MHDACLTHVWPGGVRGFRGPPGLSEQTPKIFYPGELALRDSLIGWVVLLILLVPCTMVLLAMAGAGKAP